MISGARHAVHHASSGNLDRRGLGDVSTLTVREYLTLSWWGRLCYRLYRHPIVMFGIGPTYLSSCNSGSIHVARWLATWLQHDGDEFCHRARCRDLDLALSASDRFYLCICRSS
jgi:hypothetical protein